MIQASKPLMRTAAQPVSQAQMTHVANALDASAGWPASEARKSQASVATITSRLKSIIPPRFSSRA